MPQDFSVQGPLQSHLFNKDFENIEYNANIKGQKQKQKEEKKCSEGTSSLALIHQNY